MPAKSTASWLIPVALAGAGGLVASVLTFSPPPRQAPIDRETAWQDEADVAELAPAEPPLDRLSDQPPEPLVIPKMAPRMAPQMAPLDWPESAPESAPPVAPRMSPRVARTAPDADLTASEPLPDSDAAAGLTALQEERALAAEVGQSTGPEAAPSWRSINPDGSTDVEVFYATNRRELDVSSLLSLVRLLLPMLASLAVTMAMVVGTLRGSPRWLWGCGLLVGLGASLWIAHESGLRLQTRQRLATSGSVYYGSDPSRQLPESYPLHVGISRVTLPPLHRVGQLERPSLVHLEFVERADRHVMVHDIRPLGTEAYFDQLRTRLSTSAGKSAMVFIHGYNVQFEDGLQRTAQIAYDLQFDGPAILFSWPSHGKLAAYLKDAEHAAQSVEPLERFLADIKQRTQAEHIHIIAHSMGNRVLLEALHRIAQQRPHEQPWFGQVVMAAPDVEVERFREVYLPMLPQVARQATLYASSMDRALVASTKVNGEPRIGLVGPHLHDLLGIHTIDVTPVDTSLLGHSYYGSHPLLLKDLRALIELGSAPSFRQWLAASTINGRQPVWRFRMDTADLTPPLTQQR
jgi:esterase/lipase superfamily enzyme